jgi:hypothetical protein
LIGFIRKTLTTQPPTGLDLFGAEVLFFFLCEGGERSCVIQDFKAVAPADSMASAAATDVQLDRLRVREQIEIAVAQT